MIGDHGDGLPRARSALPSADTQMWPDHPPERGKAERERGKAERERGKAERERGKAERERGKAERERG